MSEAVKETELPTEMLQQIAQTVKKHLEGIKAQLREQAQKALPPQKAVTVWLYLPEDAVEVVEEAKSQWGQPLPELSFQVDDLAIQVASPVWCFTDEQKGQVGIL